MKSLEPKYAARSEARAKLDRANDAVTRAKRLDAAAAEQLKSLEYRASQAEAADASQMAEMIAKGGLESAHSFANVDDAATQELSAARRDHSVKAKALATLEAARDDAQTELALAERAVVAAVDQILRDEITERAKKVDDLLNEASRLGLRLKYFAVAASMHSTSVASGSILNVLDRLEAPLLDARHVPVDMAKLGDVAAFSDWTQRRAALIAGDEESEPKAA
jgi:hypothetical protein